MLSQADLDEALTRARQTVRTTKALAVQLKGTRWRDILLLEVVALEAVVGRIEQLGVLQRADLAELEAEVDRVLRLAAGKIDATSRRLQ